mmetsp:Transcript_26984/g.79744  ORF Transcript_26984/g.79744 Transcript_26984/m.79744 type:complete len:258 (-) Transcript_26984:336-1109(-)
MMRNMARKPTRRIIGSPSSEKSGHGYGSPVCEILTHHGRPRPRRMLKMLEPSALQTAMSPFPSLATMIDESASGTEVPTERTSRPTISSGISRMQEARVAVSTMTKERRPIHTIDMVKVTKYHDLNLSSRQSGMVNFMANASGRAMMSRTPVPSSSSSASESSFSSSSVLPLPVNMRAVAASSSIVASWVGVVSCDEEALRLKRVSSSTTSFLTMSRLVEEETFAIARSLRLLIRSFSSSGRLMISTIIGFTTMTAM